MRSGAIGPSPVAALLPAIIERLSHAHLCGLVHVSDVVAPTLDLPQLRDRALDLAIVTLKSRMPNPVVQLFIKYVREGLRPMASMQPARR